MEEYIDMDWSAFAAESKREAQGLHHRQNSMYVVGTEFTEREEIQHHKRKVNALKRKHAQLTDEEMDASVKKAFMEYVHAADKEVDVIVRIRKGWNAMANDDGSNAQSLMKQALELKREKETIEDEVIRLYNRYERMVKYAEELKMRRNRDFNLHTSD